MKNLIIILYLFTFSISFAFAEGISNNGKYVWAVVDKSRFGSKPICVIQSTSNGWKKEFEGNLDVDFTTDSRRAIFLKGDTLNIVTLGSDAITKIAEVDNFVIPKKGGDEWLTYQKKEKNSGAVLLNLRTGFSESLGPIEHCYFNNIGTVLLISAETSNHRQLDWLNLTTLIRRIVWQSQEETISQLEFSPDSKFLAFMTRSKPTNLRGRHTDGKIWYYREDDNSSKIIVDSSSIAINRDLVVGDQKMQFSPRGTKLFFYLQERETPGECDGLKITKQLSSDNFKGVQVWTYFDAKLASQQIIDSAVLRKFEALYDFDKGRVLQIENQNEIVFHKFQTVLPIQQNDDFAVICSFQDEIFKYRSQSSTDPSEISAYTFNEYNWNRKTCEDIFLMNINTGERKLLVKQAFNPENVELFISPESKFVIYYLPEHHGWYSYDITSRITKVLTNNLTVSFAKMDAETALRAYDASSQGGWQWFRNDNAVLLYDHFSDVWQIDPSMHEKPICLTDGFARNRHIRLSTVGLDQTDFDNLNLPLNNKLLDNSKQLLLRIDPVDNAGHYFNNGFCRIKLGQRRAPEILLPIGGMYKYTEVIKASSKSMFVVLRENSTNPPDYYFTDEFKTFENISIAQTDRRVGVKQQIISWRLPDGKSCQGILYYPVDFNPKKKYPVIINYYEKIGGLTGSAFNGFSSIDAPDKADLPSTAYCANNGYFKFVPEIHYSLANTGQSALNAVVSGAQYISKFPFIDRGKMGIVGASFGGYQTNFIITHSHLFAAAVSSCGMSDFFSYYGNEDLNRPGRTHHGDPEIGQSRLGVNPWERPDIYLKNSPVFYANGVTTPLLLTHFKDDNNVPFAQSVEFFKALRRLGKKVWLITADKGGHGGPGDIWQKQFFDYYLKDKPAPEWMVKGLPARLYGLETRLNADTNQTLPKSLLMMNKCLNYQQKHLLKHRTTVSNSGRIVDVTMKSQSISGGE